MRMNFTFQLWKGKVSMNLIHVLPDISLGFFEFCKNIHDIQVLECFLIKGKGNVFWFCVKTGSKTRLKRPFFNICAFP